VSDPIHGLKLLIAEEDEATRQFLADNFAADGADVETAHSCGEALKRIYSIAPDLIVADVNGDTLRLIEKVAGEVPIIVLCREHDSDTDRVRKLERGADDVVTKPVVYYELRARAGAVMRRVRGGARRILTIGALRIDVAAHEAWLHEQRLDVSPKEFALLCKLASDPTRVFMKEELVREVWHGGLVGPRTLDSHACRLRTKLNRAGDRYVQNIWGVGYRLTYPAPERDAAAS
jgi:DNA-binding response OmpR family regulator